MIRQWEKATLASPADAKLHPCLRCKRKTDGTLAGTLKIWHCRLIPGRTWTNQITGEVMTRKPLWTARVACLDREACGAYLREQAEKRRAAQERRRPGSLPHGDAPKGSCKWCGEPIRFNEDLKGWKRRRQRSYHYGDEWELDDTRCVAHAIAWNDPKRATAWLLARQEGRCTECGETLVDEPRPWPEHWGAQNPDVFGVGLWTPNRNVDVDHRVPIWKGGTNALDNLQVICHDPCHKAKTKREAAERAKLRKAAPLAGPEQLALDSRA